MQNACPVCNYIRYLVLLTHLASLSVLIFFMRSISFLTTPTKFKGGMFLKFATRISVYGLAR